MKVRCSLKERVPVQGGFRYDHVSVRGHALDGYLYTEHPPAIGDLIALTGAPSGVGVFHVVDREWLHSSFGSTNWPYGQPEPVVGPILTVIVERAEGMFRDEVSDDNETHD